MEINIKKITKKDIKLLFGIVKKIGVESFNFDTKSKEHIGIKIAKLIVEKYADVEKELDELIISLTDITDEQLQKLELDEFIDVLTKIWSKNNIMGFIKSAK